MSDSSNRRRQHLGAAISFFTIAIVMWLTMDNVAIALPFAALAVTFFILGTRHSPRESDEDAG